MTGPAILSLFSGYGGLDLAVEAVTGGTTRWHVENEPAACAVLAYRWPDATNLGDVTTVDWSSLAGQVDVIAGGFPCTDVSPAGLYAGLGAGTRSGLWANMAVAIATLRPRLAVIENVRGLTSAKADSDLELCPWCLGTANGEPPLRALGAVLGDLADVGFDAEWCGVRASAVGACHPRFRIFIVAWPAAHAARIPRGGGDGERVPAGGPGPEGRAAADTDGEPRGQRRVPGTSEADRGRAHGDPRGRAGTPAADTEGPGREGAGGPGRAGRTGAPRRAAADPASVRRRQGRPEPARIVGGLDAPVGGPPPDGTDFGIYSAAVARHAAVTGQRPPAPVVAGGRGRRRGGNPTLNPAFEEWMMMLPPGWVTGVPGLTGRDQLRLLGNGVVPPQAVAALTHLLERAS